MIHFSFSHKSQHVLFAFFSVPNPRYDCPPHNCLSPKKCESPITGVLCENSKDVCCSIGKYYHNHIVRSTGKTRNYQFFILLFSFSVKTEFRTHCRHWGGECMDSCPKILTQRVVDCPAGKQCCVLV